MEASYQKIVNYTKEIKNLENSVANNSVANSPNITSIAFDVEMKKLELEAEEQIYATIRASYEMLVIEINNQPQELHVIQEAEEPDMKTKPSRGTICLATVFITGVVMCIFVFFKFYFRKETTTLPEVLG